MKKVVICVIPKISMFLTVQFTHKIISNNLLKITIAHRFLLLAKPVSNSLKLKGLTTDLKENLYYHFYIIIIKPLLHANTHAVLGLFHILHNFQDIILVDKPIN